MADATIGFDEPPVTRQDLQIDATSVTTDAGPVVRERVSIGDGADGAETLSIVAGAAQVRDQSVVDALAGLEFGGGVTDAEMRAAPLEVDTALEPVLADVKRSITDYETRLDYDANRNPLYVGKAAQGTLTSAAAWTIQKLEFDATPLLVRVQVKDGIAWDDRAVAF